MNDDLHISVEIWNAYYRGDRDLYQLESYQYQETT